LFVLSCFGPCFHLLFQRLSLFEFFF
jgi:hypothetical protein